MKTIDVRARFLEFFRNQGHEIVSSSSLVPVNDPTLLFTNAGMVQFKDVFLGRETPPYSRAVSSQRCVRAGGKHNDLENVGYTARHHTFFEMLGNFSFGDYFKQDAIQYAWSFLTEALSIPPEKLWITVFDEDDEAADIWLKDMGVDAARFSRIGAKDNFWSMGDTGPCGPCTEIFYDHGPDVEGGPPGTSEEDGDRYVEIWNLVFMQYNRAKDGSLTALPKPSVDTGMGLERIAAVMQGVHSNYDIDLFQHLITAAAQAVGVSDRQHVSLKVIADHIRSCAFLILDGVTPSNEGRGYVLRRIIRRAARHGYELGQKAPFFYSLVDALCEEMGDAYPDLRSAQSQIANVLVLEERRFAETLEKGMKILDDTISGLTADIIAGETVFKLYDTYGFPVDLTADIALSRGLQLDMPGFERAMEQQRQRAQAASHFDLDYLTDVRVDEPSVFTGYDQLEDSGKVIAVFQEGKQVEQLQAGQTGFVVLTSTPFYAESGGQVGDTGQLVGDDCSFQVQDTQKQGNNVYGHIGVLGSGELKPGMTLLAQVKADSRQSTARNHSATHLLHAALRAILGDHVAQKGSLVGSERLRFDFSHPEPVLPQQLQAIEQLVNEQILENYPVETAVMSMDEAMKAGAMALFGEKYGYEVRVLRMGTFSQELCGGTHVSRTGDIGLFKMIAESGVAAGVRRIEAVSGKMALQWVGDNEACLNRVAHLLKTSRDQVEDKLTHWMQKTKTMEKDLDKLKSKLAGATRDDLTSSAITIKGIQVLAAKIEGADAKLLREMVDRLKNKLGTAVVLLASVEDDKVRLVAGVTKDAMAKIKAGELVNMVAQQVGGRGGGRPDMAQAGGTQPANLDNALRSVAVWLDDKLS